MHARPRIRVTTQPPGQQRQNKQLIFLVLVGVLVLAGGAFLWWKAQQPTVTRTKGPREHRPQERAVTERPLPLRADLRMERDYTKLPLEEVKPAAPAPAPQPAPPAKPTPPPRQGPWGAPTRPTPPGGLPPQPAPPVIVQAPTGAPGTPPRAAGPPPRAPVVQARAGGTDRDTRPLRWFGQQAPIKEGRLLPPHPVDPAQAQASKLFPKAVWEIPKDPTKVLYANQVINGLLMQNINSDLPGNVRIKIPQDVVDRWGVGHVLLAKDTDLMATMDGQAKYGQKRIPLAVYMGLPPDGSAITFQKGQAGDAMGAAGVPADVNNHYGALLLGAGIQAFMNIGTRAVAGSTTGFNPTLEQEFAQDIARSANRTANQIIQRELQRNPTLSQDYGFPVTIQFTENISFQSQPSVVSK